MKILRGAWNLAYLDEITTATPDLKGYMDQVDATSGAFAWLSTKGRSSGLSIAQRRVEWSPRASTLPEGLSVASPFD